MTLEANKKLVHRFVDQVMTGGDIEAIAEFCVEGSMFAGGIEGQLRAIRSAFPDIRFAVDDILADGDKVVVCMTAHGTNTGPMVGLPAFGRLETPVSPTGKTVAGFIGS